MCNSAVNSCVDSLDSARFPMWGSIAHDFWSRSLGETFVSMAVLANREKS